MNYKGEGVPQNYKDAKYWYEKAAEQGNVMARYNLALMYYKGEGIEKDYKKARYWFERLAEQGRVEAQHNLGSDVLQKEKV